MRISDQDRVQLSRLADLFLEKAIKRPKEGDVQCFFHNQSLLRSNPKISDADEKREINQNKRRRYKSYTVNFKKQLVSSIQKQVNENNKTLKEAIKEISKYHNIHVKNLIRWYSLQQIKEKQGGRKPMHPQIEQGLIIYMKQHPNCKRRDLRREALKYYQKSIKDQNDRISLFSKGWYQRFKSRLEKRKKKADNQEKQIQEFIKIDDEQT